MAGTLTISTLSDGTNNTSSTNCIQGSAKAWVNFNGTGTVAIRSSYNVSSITDNGTGDYTVNFTTAMPDANYSTCATAGRASDANNLCSSDLATYSTSQVRIGTMASGAAPSRTDMSIVCVAIFR